MIDPTFLPSRTACFLALFAALVALAGCQQEEEIRRYTAARPQTVPAPEAKVRFLAAIFIGDKQHWFVRFTGPTAEVKEYEEQYLKLVRSVTIHEDGDPPLRWTLPSGWQQADEKQSMRYATLRFGPKDKPLEVSISAAGGSLLANINRWRGQIGLKPIADADLPKVAKSEKINGKDVILVDMGGPGGTGGPGGMGK
jgi:hypothetical protein